VGPHSPVLLVTLVPVLHDSTMFFNDCGRYFRSHHQSNRICLCVTETHRCCAAFL